MEFTLSKLKNKKEKTVEMPVSLVEELITLTFKAECTAVYDPRNNEYVKLNDIPEDLSDRLQTLLKLNH